MAIGINWEGRRGVLAVELANRESESGGKEFLLWLKQRGLCGVVWVISDDHSKLRKNVRETNIGRILATMDGSHIDESLVFSPDGTLILSSGVIGPDVWNVPTKVVRRADLVEIRLNGASLKPVLHL